MCSVGHFDGRGSCLSWIVSTGNQCREWWRNAAGSMPAARLNSAVHALTLVRRSAMTCQVSGVPAAQVGQLVNSAAVTPRSG